MRRRVRSSALALDSDSVALAPPPSALAAEHASPSHSDNTNQDEAVGDDGTAYSYGDYRQTPSGVIPTAAPSLDPALEQLLQSVQPVDSSLRLGRKLGGGAFGDVHMGWLRGTPVAVKTLKLQDQQSTSSTFSVYEKCESFLWEYRRLEAASYPFVVSTVRGGVQRRGQDMLLFVLEFCGGGDLAHAIADAKQNSTAGVLPLRAMWRFSVHIFSALDMVHRSGMIHTDLKPGNVLLTAPISTKSYKLKKEEVEVPETERKHQEAGAAALSVNWPVAKLADLGLSQADRVVQRRGEAAPEVVEAQIKDRWWCSPEEAGRTFDKAETELPVTYGAYRVLPESSNDDKKGSSSNRVSPASDVFAAGLVLAHLVTGVEPSLLVAEALASVSSSSAGQRSRTRPTHRINMDQWLSALRSGQASECILSAIPTTHPLRQVVRQCLSLSPSSRPTAAQCEQALLSPAVAVACHGGSVTATACALLEHHNRLFIHSSADARSAFVSQTAVTSDDAQGGLRSRRKGADNGLQRDAEDQEDEEKEKGRRMRRKMSLLRWLQETQACNVVLLGDGGTGKSLVAHVMVALSLGLMTGFGYNPQAFRPGITASWATQPSQLLHRVTQLVAYLLLAFVLLLSGLLCFDVYTGALRLRHVWSGLLVPYVVVFHAGMGGADGLKVWAQRLYEQHRKREREDREEDEDEEEDEAGVNSPLFSSSSSSSSSRSSDSRRRERERGQASDSGLADYLYFKLMSRPSTAAAVWGPLLALLLLCVHVALDLFYTGTCDDVWFAAPLLLPFISFLGWLCLRSTAIMAGMCRSSPALSPLPLRKQSYVNRALIRALERARQRIRIRAVAPVQYVLLRPALAPNWRHEDMQDGIRRALTSANGYGLSAEMVSALQTQDRFRIIFWLDAYDELQVESATETAKVSAAADQAGSSSVSSLPHSSYENLPATLGLSSAWPHASLVVTCRRETVPASLLRARFGDQTTGEAPSVRYILPFSPKQIQLFLHRSGVAPSDASRLLASSADTDVLRIPFVLHLFCTGLQQEQRGQQQDKDKDEAAGSSGDEERKHGPAAAERHNREAPKLTRVKVYEQALLRWCVALQEQVNDSPALAQQLSAGVVALSGAHRATAPTAVLRWYDVSHDLVTHTGIPESLSPVQRSFIAFASEVALQMFADGNSTTLLCATASSGTSSVSVATTSAVVDTAAPIVDSVWLHAEELVATHAMDTYASSTGAGTGLHHIMSQRDYVSLRVMSWRALMAQCPLQRKGGGGGGGSRLTFVHKTVRDFILARSMTRTPLPVFQLPRHGQQTHTAAAIAAQTTREQSDGAAQVLSAYQHHPLCRVHVTRDAAVQLLAAELIDGEWMHHEGWELDGDEVDEHKRIERRRRWEMRIRQGWAFRDGDHDVQTDVAAVVADGDDDDDDDDADDDKDEQRQQPCAVPAGEEIDNWCFEEGGWAVVRATRIYPELAVAGANVLSILNTARVPLSGRMLRGIVIGDPQWRLSYPCADLAGSLLHSTDLRGAQLGGVSLRDACMDKACLAGADMRGVRWGVLPHMHGYEAKPPTVLLPSLDGSALCTWAPGQPLIVWSTWTGQQLERCNSAPGQTAQPALAWAPDGQQLYCGWSNGTVVQLNLAVDKMRAEAKTQSQAICVVEGLDSSVMSLAVSPSGAELCIGCARAKQGVLRYSTVTLMLLGHYGRHSSQIPRDIHCITYAPDGHSVFVSSTVTDPQASESGTQRAQQQGKQQEAKEQKSWLPEDASLVVQWATRGRAQVQEDEEKQGDGGGCTSQDIESDLLAVVYRSDRIVPVVSLLCGPHCRFLYGIERVVWQSVVRWLAVGSSTEVMQDQPQEVQGLLPQWPREVLETAMSYGLADSLALSPDGSRLFVSHTSASQSYRVFDADCGLPADLVLPSDVEPFPPAFKGAVLSSFSPGAHTLFAALPSGRIVQMSLTRSELVRVGVPRTLSEPMSPRLPGILRQQSSQMFVEAQFGHAHQIKLLATQDGGIVSVDVGEDEHGLVMCMWQLSVLGGWVLVARLDMGYAMRHWQNSSGGSIQHLERLARMFGLSGVELRTCTTFVDSLRDTDGSGGQVMATDVAGLRVQVDPDGTGLECYVLGKAQAQARTCTVLYATEETKTVGSSGSSSTDRAVVETDTDAETHKEEMVAATCIPERCAPGVMLWRSSLQSSAYNVDITGALLDPVGLRLLAELSPKQRQEREREQAQALPSS